MNTRIYSLISAAVLPFALFSCMKDADVILDQQPAPLVTIQAAIPSSSPATKIAPITPESGVGLDWTWESGDKIAVGAGETLSVFDIRSGFEPQNASFIGKQVNGDVFNILYPGTGTVADLEALSFADQYQTGIDAKDHLKYYALLENVNEYKSFEFSSTWAQEHGGALKQGGVLRFNLTLPAETAVVTSVSLKADKPIFHTGNVADALSDELVVNIAEGTLDADKTLVAWMTTSWFNDVIPAGTELSVTVGAGESNWVSSFTVATEKAIQGGAVNTITLGADTWASAGRYAEGSGTEEDPWIIKTPSQLASVGEDLVSQEMRYFKLAADIDLSGIEWVPYNTVEPYDKYLYFDGDGHTISNLTITEGAVYASFAGVLYGTIKDVVFTKASIVAGEGNKSGIIAGYVGTADAFTPCLIENVEVKNSSITAARSMGAFVGQVATADAVFKNCRVSNTTVTQTATSTSHAGGFVGYVQAAASFDNCSTDAAVTGTEFTGGFAGYIGKGTFTNCWASGQVSGTKHVGGFVGKSESPTVTACWYDGPEVSASASGSNQSGGFVGYAAKFVGSYQECYVKNAAIKMSAGQRIGGFVGQADLGNTFLKCYVQNVTIEGGQDSGGFVGYHNADASGTSGGTHQCYVDGGSITAGGNEVGGFVGYIDKSVIKNCFTTMDVDGADKASIGGFIGIAKKNMTVQYCYAAGNVQGTSSPVGAFVGKVDGALASTHINACIAWNATLPFAGQTVNGDVSGNYAGTDGTLAEQAKALAWDPDIWNFSATLK